MTSDSHYLSAYTPSKLNSEDVSEYFFYPPFVNFTQIGDRVRIMVRSKDKQIEGKPTGWYDTISSAEMDMPVSEFKDLLEKALENLQSDR